MQDSKQDARQEFMQAKTSKDLYVFNTNAQSELFSKISKELRCMVCQNQSVFDSKAPVAVSLKTEIHHQILENKTETEILECVVARYGDAIVYQPPFNKTTLVLWAAPWLMLVLVCFIFSKSMIAKTKSHL